MTEEIIKIKHNEYILTLEKTGYTDLDWVDMTIENTKNGRCTAISKFDSDIFYSLLPLIDTDWVDCTEESEQE